MNDKKTKPANKQCIDEDLSIVVDEASDSLPLETCSNAVDGTDVQVNADQAIAKESGKFGSFMSIGKMPRYFRILLLSYLAAGIFKGLWLFTWHTQGQFFLYPCVATGLCWQATYCAATYFGPYGLLGGLTALFGLHFATRFNFRRYKYLCVLLIAFSVGAVIDCVCNCLPPHTVCDPDTFFECCIKTGLGHGGFCALTGAFTSLIAAESLWPKQADFTAGKFKALCLFSVLMTLFTIATCPAPWRTWPASPWPVEVIPPSPITPLLIFAYAVICVFSPVFIVWFSLLWAIVRDSREHRLATIMKPGGLVEN